MVNGQQENQKRPTGIHAFVGLLLDGHEKLEERLIVLEEFVRERLILWKVAIEQANSKADLGLGHFFGRHNRELWQYIKNVDPERQSDGGTDPLFARKAEVLAGLISNHVVDNTTNKGDRGLSHSVREKPTETLRGLLRVTGKIDGAEISLVCTGDKLDSGGFVEDGREDVGERHCKVRG